MSLFFSSAKRKRKTDLATSNEKQLKNCNFIRLLPLFFSILCIFKNIYGIFYCSMHGPFVSFILFFSNQDFFAVCILFSFGPFFVLCTAVYLFRIEKKNQKRKINFIQKTAQQKREISTKCVCVCVYFSFFFQPKRAKSVINNIVCWLLFSSLFFFLVNC